jgi:thioesterase domain-containing protein/acyl carrier protein
MAASARKHDGASLLLPRTEQEHLLALLWQAVLGVEQVGISDSFFELGGHSLLVISMIERLQETLGSTLPLATLLQHTTIAELTQVLDETAKSGNTYQSLVPIQPDGTQPPFFAIHPAAGNVLCYVPWAQRLGTLQPLYALQAIGLDGHQLPPTTIEAMAAQYIAEIQTVQPCGPYRLGGWSLGGVIALEMAQQLQRWGAVVDVLVVIDSVLAHRDDPTTLLQGFLMTLHGRFLELPAPMRMEVQDVTSDPNAALHWLLEPENGAALLPPGISKDRMYVLWNVYKALAGARARYIPTMYPGRITYLYAQEQSNLISPSWTGWEQIAGGGIEYYPVPGDHFSMMSHPENRQVIAERLTLCLARIADHTTNRAST